VKGSPRGPALAVGLLFVLASWCAAAPVPLAGQPKEVAALTGHPFDIVALAFSPDGKLLASAGDADGTARIWDVEAGKCLHVLKGHGPGRADDRILVTGVAFSPDGKTVASCGDDGTVRLWGATSGKAIAVIQAGGWIHSLQFSPDGKTLAWISDQLHLWDLEQGKECGTFKFAGHVYHFTPSGKLLGAGKDSTAGFTVWDADAAGKGIAFRGHPNDEPGSGVADLAISPGGKMVASCGFDKTVRLWDIATAKEIATFDQKPIWPRWLQFSPGGKVLAVGQTLDLERRSKVGIVLFLEVPSGKVLGSIKEERGFFGPFAFSPDGRLFAVAYQDRTIKVWRLPEEWGTGK